MDKETVQALGGLKGPQLFVVFILALGFAWAVPLTPVLVELVKDDVERRVFDETFKEREKALRVQSDLLGLQDEYLTKLKTLQVREAELVTAREELVRRNRAFEQAKAEHTEEIETIREAETACLRGRAASVAASRRQQKAADQFQARWSPWKDHVCSVESIKGANEVEEGKVTCVVGIEAYFASGTSDEKRFESVDTNLIRLDHGESPRFACIDAHPNWIEERWDFHHDRALRRCEQHRKAFLKEKGIPDNELETDGSIWKFYLNDL